MANATGIRRSDELLRTGHGFAEVGADARDLRGRSEQLIAAAALEFYKAAFGAEETLRLDEPGGRVGHRSGLVREAVAEQMSDAHSAHLRALLR